LATGTPRGDELTRMEMHLSADAVSVACALVETGGDQRVSARRFTPATVGVRVSRAVADRGHDSKRQIPAAGPLRRAVSKPGLRSRGGGQDARDPRAERSPSQDFGPGEEVRMRETFVPSGLQARTSVPGRRSGCMKTPRSDRSLPRASVLGDGRTLGDVPKQRPRRA
jgi:hypothetical protein